MSSNLKCPSLEETLQKTFRDAGLIHGHFKEANDEQLTEYLVEFLKSYDEDAEYQSQKNRKRELQSQLEVMKASSGF